MTQYRSAPDVIQTGTTREGFPSGLKPIWPTFTGDYAQYMARLERVSIMSESGAPDTEANLHCNHQPDIYGHVEVIEKQEKLF